MRELIIKGFSVLIDEDDFERVSQYNWGVINSRGLIYIYSGRGKNSPLGNGKILGIHRFIMNAPIGKVVDHINHNTLDNRKSNLRICTIGENAINRSPNKRGYSKYKGVSWDTDCKKWTAVVSKNKKTVYKKRFKTEMEAAIAYNENALIHHGEFAHINDFSKT